ncbi:MAG TPA: LytR C-terminal domain-containing protein [Solirubrobacterales bacterium]|nr:LytR C-terminal domain-containing protein [Solirubrobacterales bacterium]
MELVERVGSYVGFAAFLGLAILALLYFSQARDVRRLRDWAGRAPERAVELEQGDRATEVAPATPAAQHSLPATPFSQASEPRKRKPLRERIRNVHIPYARYIAMGAAGLLVAGGVAFGVIQLTGDDGGTTASTTNSDRGEDRSQNGRQDRRQAANVDPSQVTVAVLNGTTVQGLAAQVAEEATAGGFTPGTTGNAARVDQTESEVLYRPGQARAARAVANRLGINRTGPVDSVNQEIAGSFDVVVLVGTDRQ